MCILEIGKKVPIRFLARSITIGDHIFDGNAFVEISSSRIRFEVLHPTVGDPFQIEITGDDIRMVWLDSSGQCGSILLFTRFSWFDETMLILGSRQTTDRLYSLSNAFAEDRISFEVNELTADIQNGIRGLRNARNMKVVIFPKLDEETTSIVSSNDSAADEEREEKVQLTEAGGSDNDGDQQNECVEGDAANASGNSKQNADDQKMEIQSVENTQRSGAKITEDDLSTLSPREWLNDKVIMVYLEHQIAKIADQTGTGANVILLDNFFLRSVGRDIGIDVEGFHPIESSLKSVDVGLAQQISVKKKRAIKRIKASDAEYIVFPICDASHWFVMIVRHPAKLTQLEGDIFVFDSMRCSGHLDSYKKYLHVLRHFVVACYLEKVERDGSALSCITDYLLNCVNLPKVPQQDNVYDCGLFATEYVERFLANPDPNQSWPEMFDPKKLIRTKRKHIRNVLMDYL